MEPYQCSNILERRICSKQNTADIVLSLSLCCSLILHICKYDYVSIQFYLFIALLALLGNCALYNTYYIISSCCQEKIYYSKFAKDHTMFEMEQS